MENTNLTNVTNDTAVETAINNAANLVAAPKTVTAGMPKYMKVASIATIGMAAVGVVETGLLYILIKRNGGMKMAFAKKAALKSEDIESFDENK